MHWKLGLCKGSLPRAWEKGAVVWQGRRDEILIPHALWECNATFGNVFKNMEHVSLDFGYAWKVLGNKDEAYVLIP